MIRDTRRSIATPFAYSPPIRAQKPRLLGTERRRLARETTQHSFPKGKLVPAIEHVLPMDVFSPQFRAMRAPARRHSPTIEKIAPVPSIIWSLQIGHQRPWWILGGPRRLRLARKAWWTVVAEWSTVPDRGGSSSHAVTEAV